MSKIFYISDYHFYHYLALKRSRQVFDSIDQMNEEMIIRHNEKVSQEDNVYILGDIIVCEEEELSEKLNNTIGRLNGRLHLIVGNHDYKYLDNPLFRQYFKSIDEAKLIRDNNRWVQLCHYPILMWYRKNKGAYHVFGHMHNEQKSREYHILKEEERALNACVEINKFEPCELEELIENNSMFKRQLK